MLARLPASDSSVPWALNVQELQGPVAHVLLPAEDARHEHEQRVVAARRRDRVDHLVGEHRLPLRALHVDDRRLAASP